jgi:hypothetical protein
MAKDSVPGASKDLVPRKANKTAQKVAQDSVPNAVERETANIGNYLHMIREQLTKECQSYEIASNSDIINDSATVATMNQRVLDAIKV